MVGFVFFSGLENPSGSFLCPPRAREASAATSALQAEQQTHIVVTAAGSSCSRSTSVSCVQESALTGRTHKMH